MTPDEHQTATERAKHITAHTLPEFEADIRKMTLPTLRRFARDARGESAIASLMSHEQLVQALLEWFTDTCYEACGVPRTDS